jgi:hypothetical protein
MSLPVSLGNIPQNKLVCPERDDSSSSLDGVTFSRFYVSLSIYTLYICFLSLYTSGQISGQIIFLKTPLSVLIFKAYKLYIWDAQLIAGCEPIEPFIPIVASSLLDTPLPDRVCEVPHLIAQFLQF